MESKKPPDPVEIDDRSGHSKATAGASSDASAQDPGTAY